MHKFGDEQLSGAAGRIWSEGQSCTVVHMAMSS
jgi:hypothetical protein